MSAITDALNGLKTTVLTMNPTPQASLVNAWVYPTSYASINLAALPVAIVSRVVGVVDSWGLKAAGVGLHRWRAEVLIPLAVGPLRYPNEASAAAEAKQDTYEKALADVLFGDMTLGGTVLQIGEGGIPSGFKLFDCMINHMQWNQQVYWGFRFVIPISQKHIQTMAA